MEAISLGETQYTAQEVAEQVGRMARRRNLEPRVLPMDGYPVRNLTEEPMVVFVVATTGEGECPDNMKKAWRFLRRKELPRNSLAGMDFAVFGMGDSSYEKFNAVARMLNARLKQLGGNEIVQRGLGDDQSENGESKKGDCDRKSILLKQNVHFLPMFFTNVYTFL